MSLFSYIFAQIEVSWLVTLHFMVPGAAWAWLVIPLGDQDSGRKGLTLIRIAAFCGATAVVPLLLMATALAEYAVLPPAAGVVIALFLAGAGFVTGIIVNRQRLARALLQSLPGVIFIFAGAMIIMILPHQSEWVLGGWDPGIYVNEGVYVAEHGTFQPEPEPHLSLLTEEELFLFSRGEAGCRECFPGVPVNLADRSYDFFFFRLTPTFIAILYRCGGLDAALRANLFAGLLAVVTFMGFLATFKRWSLVIFATLLLISQPIFLYHLHVPVSEMLQLFLLFGIATLLPHRENNRATLPLLALLIFACMLNRFDFLLFGTLLLLWMAWIDLERDDRRQVLREHVWLIVALLAGTAFDATRTFVTFQQLGGVVTPVAAGAIACMAVTLGTDILAMRDPIQRSIRRIADVAAPAYFVLIAMILPIGAYMLRWPPLAEFAWNTPRLLPYIGLPLLILACLGAAAAWRTRLLPRSMTGLALFLASAMMITLVQDYIVNHYPWATRRHLTFTVPLIALCGGTMLTILWSMKRALVGRALAVALATGVLLASAKQSYHAWDRTEYVGVTSHLAQVAAQLEPEGVVVADHFRWGTPLTFIFDRQVLNGERLWFDHDADRFRRGLAAVRKLHDAGRRVRFLTSTEDGMDVYPDAINGLRLDWEGTPFEYEELMHHRNAAGFELRTRAVMFRLYTWQPDSPP